MGTIAYLKDRLQRRGEAQRLPVRVTAHGFVVGATFVPWQSVSQIRAFKTDLVTSDEAFLAFHFADQSLHVSEAQAGFQALEAAMIAAFPSTAGWREAVLQPAFARNETVLFRRG